MAPKTDVPTDETSHDFTEPEPFPTENPEPHRQQHAVRPCNTSDTFVVASPGDELFMQGSSSPVNIEYGAEGLEMGRLQKADRPTKNVTFAETRAVREFARGEKELASEAGNESVSIPKNVPKKKETGAERSAEGKVLKESKARTGQ